MVPNLSPDAHPHFERLARVADTVLEVLAAVQQAVAADAQQLAPIDPWYRSGEGRRAPALTVSAVGRS